jgi:hypothetical protein
VSSSASAWWGTAAGNVQDLALAHDHLFAIDEKSQRTLEHVSHLFALVRVHRYKRAAFEIDLRHHLPLAADDLLRHHFCDLLEGDFVPPMQSRVAHRLLPSVT